MLEDSELCEVNALSLFNLLGHVASNTKIVVDNVDSCTRISNVKKHIIIIIIIIIIITVNFYSADMNSNVEISGSF